MIFPQAEAYYQILRRHKPEDGNLNSHASENSKCRMFNYAKLIK
jgi:hypothetical protein